MKFIGYRTLKTVIGAVAAMYLAMHFQLKFATVAGIIAILSLRSTRKQSLQFACKMLGAFLLALLISTFLFRFLGYTPLVFGLFLLLFIPLSARLKLQDGIVVSSVLITQLLVEKSVEPSFILNQLSLMTIGVVTALFLNLYMPSFENKIKEEQDTIEQTIKTILLNMSTSLRKQVVSIQEEALFSLLEQRINAGRDIAYKNRNNRFSSQDDYTRYMDTRLQQLHCLKNMRKRFEKLSITYKQTLLIADFTTTVANSVASSYSAKKLLDSLNELRQNFAAMDLPRDRVEFENRGILFQFLHDIEEFLMLEAVIK